MSIFFPWRRKKAKRTPTVCACTHDSSFIILDVETTGFSPGTDKIVQLSAIKYDCNGRPYDSFNTYINPGRDIPARAFAVHGISEDMVSGAPAAAEIRDEFLSFIGCDELLIGYNTPFDLGFLNAEFGGVCDGRQYVDVLQLARMFFSTPNHRLETVSRAIGFSPQDGFHDAFSDCEAVAAILSSICVDLEDFYSEYHPRKPTAQSKSHLRQYKESLGIDEEPIIIPDRQLDPFHPLYGKNVVFTGLFSMSRESAKRQAESAGAVVKTVVSKHTHYLVVGKQDIALVGDDGMSQKEEKAYELNSCGKAQIEIIGEQEFLDLVNSSPADYSVPENFGEQTALSGFEAPDHAEFLYLDSIFPRLLDAVEEQGGIRSLLTRKATKPDGKSGGYSVVKFHNFTSFRLRLRGNQFYISLPIVFQDLIPKDVPTKQLKSDAKYIRLLVDQKHPIESYSDFLVTVAGETVNRYPKEFDCCSRYMECSDAKACTHPDKAFALCCGYRKILHSGKIFYGKNRNID